MKIHPKEKIDTRKENEVWGYINRYADICPDIDKDNLYNDIMLCSDTKKIEYVRGESFNQEKRFKDIFSEAGVKLEEVCLCRNYDVAVQKGFYFVRTPQNGIYKREIIIPYSMFRISSEKRFYSDMCYGYNGAGPGSLRVILSIAGIQDEILAPVNDPHDSDSVVLTYIMNNGEWSLTKE